MEGWSYRYPCRYSHLKIVLWCGSIYLIIPSHIYSSAPYLCCLKDSHVFTLISPFNGYLNICTSRKLYPLPLYVLALLPHNQSDMLYKSMSKSKGQLILHSKYCSKTIIFTHLLNLLTEYSVWFIDFMRAEVYRHLNSVRYILLLWECLLRKNDFSVFCSKTCVMWCDANQSLNLQFPMESVLNE